MSAQLLTDPYKGSVLQDDLESFLHVLLYFAIRYFKHNCPLNNVGRFMYEYFDGAIYAPSDGWTSGEKKLRVMETGELKLFDKRPFVFNDDENYPMHVIIQGLLALFKAYYAAEQRRHDARKSQVVNQDQRDRQRDERLDEARREAVKEAKQGFIASVIAARLASALAEDSAIADALKTHSHMLAVFDFWLVPHRAVFWPDDDRADEDQLPEN